MIRKPPVTKDKRRQKRIIAAARRQCDKLGLGVDIRYNATGEMLIDGKTAAEIDAAHDEAMKRFYRENMKYLDQKLINPDYMPKDSLPLLVYELPAPMGPFPKVKETIVHKFESR